MNSNEIRNAFNELRSNIRTADENIISMLPCIAGRLRLCGAGKSYGYGCEALSDLKRELRDWDINKQRWKV